MSSRSRRFKSLPGFYRRWRSAWARNLHRPGPRLLVWLDLMISDHGFLRPLFNRPCRIAPGVYRSAQPSPATLKRLARSPGIRSVLNLRGESVSGYHQLEKHTCDTLSIGLFSIKLSSRRAPSPARIHELAEIFDRAEQPMLLHCKSGADRAGLVAALYLLIRNEGSPEDARRQLSLRFLHIRSAKTGILDHVLEAYAGFNARQPIAFLDWVDHYYDPEQLTRTFKPRGWANLLVDGLLRRE